MKYPDSSRAIIIRDKNLLVIKRNKFGEQYYTLPGGGIEKGESPEKAMVRELKEEANLELTKYRLVFTEHPPEPYGLQYIFLCSDPGGEVSLPETSIEAKLNMQGDNTYQPLWLPLKELPEVNFLSQKLKEAILNGVNKGFPDKATTF